MKELKDYLHLYPGVTLSTPYGEAKFCYIRTDLSNSNPVIVDKGDNYLAFNFHEIKPILRTLSDMTEDQKKFYGGRHSFDALEFAYLLKEGFDLFGLIEAGIAIDKTKM